jgi:hypothetical protein
VKRSVESSCDFRHVSGRRITQGAARTTLWTRPDPGRLSYEEAARAVLGDGADEHLAQLIRVLVSQPATQVNAVVYLTARR